MAACLGTGRNCQYRTIHYLKWAVSVFQTRNYQEEISVKLNEDKKEKLELTTAKGTRDYHPHQMVLRNNVKNSIEACFKRHGAQEIDTPVFELKTFLTEEGDKDTEKLIFSISEHGRDFLGLRYDLTVPFARYLAQNQITNFKRYQIGKVYRRDDSVFAKARLREFIQCDFDIAGHYDSMIPDAECIRIINEVFTDLKMDNFSIRINHRGLLDGLLASCQIPPDCFNQICKIIDKLDKISWNEVALSLQNNAKLEAKAIEKIHYFIKEKGRMDLIEELMKNSSLMQYRPSKDALEDLKLLFHYLDLYSALDKVVLDLSLARGLEYYTGVIYEVSINDVPEIGSVAGGGRYDNLVAEIDPKGHPVPCVGISIGFERICFLLENKLKANNTTIQTCETQVYVASAQKNFHEERMKLCKDLWNANIKTELSYKKNPKLLDQLQYCEKNNVPLAVIVGEEELKKNIIKIRHVMERKEIEVPREKLVDELRKYFCIKS